MSQFIAAEGVPMVEANTLHHTSAEVPALTAGTTVASGSADGEYEKRRRSEWGHVLRDDSGHAS